MTGPDPSGSGEGGSADWFDPRELDPERIVVTDKRRVHLDDGTATAAPEQPAAAAAPDAAEPETPQPEPDARSEELLADLQRVTAEYANYRKRVDRDRVAVIEAATATLLDHLLPLLDDVDRARQHGDLTGGFKGVGEALETVTAKLGLERFGVPGEPFDPAVHEALMAAPENPESAVPTCAQVLQQGYRLSTGRVLRPARVAVAEPGLVGSVEPAGADVPVLDED